MSSMPIWQARLKAHCFALSQNKWSIKALAQYYSVPAGIRMKPTTTTTKQDYYHYESNFITHTHTQKYRVQNAPKSSPLTVMCPSAKKKRKWKVQFNFLNRRSVPRDSASPADQSEQPHLHTRSRDRSLRHVWIGGGKADRFSVTGRLHVAVFAFVPKQYDDGNRDGTVFIFKCSIK